ncbi:MAG TPA: DUF695 domain-containing protein [Burkholderiales bacterium]|nr:DUF695 domain-containing protein [Burkholderiales bacterium]
MSLRRSGLLLAGLLWLGGAGADGPWIVVDGSENGEAVTTMARQRAPDDAMRSRFPMELTIEWRYGMEHRGMPSAEMLQDMYALEDAFEKALEEKGLAILALARTGNGMRRWTYYAASNPGVVAAAQKAAKAHKAPAKVSIRRDAQWTALRDIHARRR